MTAVSMGALRDTMGASGAITMSKLFRNGYTRTFASDGIRKINCFQVELGRAPNPDSEGTTNHSLSEFTAYQHTQIPAGANLNATVGNGQATITWSKVAGYTRDEPNNIQLLFKKDLGTVYDPINEGDPFTGGSSQDVADVTSFILTGLTVGNFYAIGVKSRRNDSVANSDAGAGHAAAGSLNSRVVSDSFNSGESIVIGPIFNSIPVLDSVGPTNEDTCIIGQCGVIIRLTFGSGNGGPLSIEIDEQVDGGGWTNVRTVGSTTGITDFTGRCDAAFYEYRIRYIGGSNSAVKSTTPGCITPA